MDKYRLWDVDRTGSRPDNFTDKNFLESLVINANVNKRSYWKLVWHSTSITQQLSIAIIVPAIFLHVKRKTLSVQMLLCFNLSMLLMAALLLVATSPRSRLGPTMLRALRQCTLLFLGLYNLSPLYQSLTASVSLDTIVAASTALVVIHLYLHGYNFTRGITETIPGSISLGAAIAASILLSSRLSLDGAVPAPPRDKLQAGDTWLALLMPSLPRSLRGSNEVFAYLSFALELFVLSPYLRKNVKENAPRMHVAATLVMVTAALVAVQGFSSAAAVAITIAIVFLTFITPWLLITVEKSKTQINGPWDEAAIFSSSASAPPSDHHDDADGHASPHLMQQRWGKDKSK